VSTRMAAAHGLVRAPARSRVRAPSSATLRLELLLLNTIPQGSSPAGLVLRIAVQLVAKKADVPIRINLFER
jgi:hypothetical protein